jgi:hypothetical protein
VQVAGRGRSILRVTKPGAEEIGAENVELEDLGPEKT